MERIIRFTLLVLLLVMGGCKEDHPTQEVGDAGLTPDTDVAPDGQVMPDADVAPDGQVMPDADVAPDGQVTPDADESSFDAYMGDVTDAPPVEEPDALPDNIECPGPLPPVVLAFNNADGTCRLEFSRHYVRRSLVARTRGCCLGEEYWYDLGDAEISERDSQYLAVTLQPDQVVDGAMWLGYQGYRDAEIRGEDDPLHWPHLSFDRLSRLDAEGSQYFNCDCPEDAEPWDERCSCLIQIATNVEYDDDGVAISCELYPDGNIADWPPATFQNEDEQTCYEHLPQAMSTESECTDSGCTCSLVLHSDFLNGGEILRFLPLMGPSGDGPLNQYRCSTLDEEGRHRLTFSAEELLEQFGEVGRYGRFSIYGGETGDCADLEDEGMYWMPFRNNDLIPYHSYEMRQFAHCHWYDGEAGELAYEGPYGWCTTSVAIDLEYDALLGEYTCHFRKSGNMGTYTMRLNY